jgi:uncharacterized protein (DUF927 family)
LYLHKKENNTKMTKKFFSQFLNYHSTKKAVTKNKTFFGQIFLL